MSRKGQDLFGAPVVDRPAAIELLTAQIEAGRRLLQSRPLTQADHARWELNTKRGLEKSFGRGSPNVVAIIDYGSRSTCPVGADRRWWENYRSTRLSGQLVELGKAIAALGGVPFDANDLLAPTPSSSSPEDPTSAACEELFANWASDMEPPRPANAPAKRAAPAQPEFFTGVACLNGHVLTAAAEAQAARATPRCQRCGAATLRACRECGAGLRGSRHATNVDDRAEPPWAVPNYCHACGAAFPWMRLKRDALEAIIAELQDLDAIEKDALLTLAADTIDETPKTSVAIMRWQRALGKLPPPTRLLVADVLKQAAARPVADHLGLSP